MLTSETHDERDHGSVLFMLGLLVIVAGIGLFTRTFEPAVFASITLALGAGGYFLVRPELPVHIVLFAVYTNAAVVAAQEGAVPAPVAAGIGVLLAIPLVHQLAIRKNGVVLDAIFGLMVVLLGIFLVSSAFAVDGGTALARIGTYVVEGLAVYFVFVNTIRSLPTLQRIVWTLLVGASLLAGLAVYQGLTGSYDQDFGGLAKRSFGPDIENAEEFEELLRTQPEVAEQMTLADRAHGPVGDPNRFAQILMVVLPLSLFQFRHGETALVRAFGLGSGLLILSAILLTYSRGAFVTLVVLVAILVALGHMKPSRIVAGVLALVVAIPFLAPGYYERIGSISSALDMFGERARVSSEAVTRGRTTETLAAVYAFIEHPVLGVGPGQYLPHYSVHYQLKPEISFRHLPEPRRAHNLYAEFAAETGVPGILVFLSIPALLLRRLWKRRRALLSNRPDLAFLATAFGLGLLAYLGTGVFLHLAFERYYWLFVALTAAACHVLSGEVGTRGEEIDESRTTRRR